MIHSQTDSRWATSGDERLEPTFDGSRMGDDCGPAAVQWHGLELES